MKRCFYFICFCIALHSASEDIFSKERLENYNTQYVTNAKQLASQSGITQPPYASGLLPIVIVNNSGHHDKDVYILVLGKKLDGVTEIFVDIQSDKDANPGLGTQVLAAPLTSGDAFNIKLSDLPEAATFNSGPGRVFYMPPISGGRIYFAMLSPLEMPITAGSITQPSISNPTDPNINTRFDKYEVAYIPGGNPPVNIDATAVDFFSIPLQGVVFNGTKSSAASGLSQTWSQVLASVQATFKAQSNAPELTQWQTLLQQDSSNTIIRIISPGLAMSPTPDIMDANYLDNATDYSFSYIEDVWSAAGSFYLTNPSNLHITIPEASMETYSGVVNGDGSITFTSNTSAYVFTMTAPTKAPPNSSSMSFNIFSGVVPLPFTVPGVKPAPTADVVQVSKMFEEAIVTGIIPKLFPSSSPLSLANFEIANYYKVNTNLSAAGQSSGPWYSLYSKALHDVGGVNQGILYTFAFDDQLWPNALIGSGYTNGSTYSHITIGNVTD